MLVMFTEDALTFFTVTLFDALVPTTTFVKLADVGEKVNGKATPPLPLPLSATTSGLWATPSVTETAPLIAPF
jgi:hypothetical protein